jgi:hypothetical protein
MMVSRRFGWRIAIVALLFSAGGSGCGDDGSAGGGNSPLVFEANPGKGKGPKPKPVPAPDPEPAPDPAPDPVPDPAPQGWTPHAPSADSLVVYVSDSDGNDADNGLTEATAKRTLTAGKALLRSGYPDWMLLKAGDTFTNQSLGSWSKSGRGSSEPMVVGSYGAGSRPRLLTGDDSPLMAFNAAKSHLAFVGLHFFPHTYAGSEGTPGVLWLCGGQNILFEDCLVEGYKDNFVVQADNGPVQNFRVRRCVIVDSWSNSSHSQGFYAYGVDGLLVEECVFDHNGWKEGGVGPATMFNHNTYLEECSNVVFRGNLFLRASSMGNKFCSNSTGAFANTLVENNAYLEGEIGISIGGNTTSALRFSNVTIRNNVMMNIGRTQPTNRDLAWYLEIKDWDGGLVEQNLFLHQSLLENCYGIRFAGQSERDTTVQANVFYALKGQAMEVWMDGSESGLVVQDNEFQDPTNGGKMITHSGSFSPLAYQGNSYFTTASSSAWFEVNGSNRSHAQWVTASGETGSSAVQASYPDPGRTEATYMSSLGGTPTMAAFAAEARAQSRSNWRSEFTAAAINTYVRAGFGR